MWSCWRELQSYRDRSIRHRKDNLCSYENVRYLDHLQKFGSKSLIPRTRLRVEILLQKWISRPNFRFENHIPHSLSSFDNLDKTTILITKGACQDRTQKSIDGKKNVRKGRSSSEVRKRAQNRSLGEKLTQQTWREIEIIEGKTTQIYIIQCSLR